MAEENKIDYILTAHHQNDNHTNFSFQRYKNGIGSLKGIPDRNGIILRPLLQFTKTQHNVSFKKIKLNMEQTANLTSMVETL